jgi:hypothetical protein
LGNTQIWLRKNGTNLPETNSHYDVPDKQGSAFSSQILTVNFVLNVSAGDYIELVWQTSNTNVYLEYLSATGSYPATPSVVFTATQVMYTQLGPTGSTGIQGPTGSTGGSGPTGPTGASGSGGGASFTVGQVVQSITGPTGGTWLQTGKYYSKATYSALAAALGDVPDIGTPVVKAKAQIPVTCTFNNTNARALYCMATNGSAWVFGTQAASKFIYTTDGAAFSAVPINAATISISGVWYVNSQFVATVNPGATASSVGIVVSPDGIAWTPRTVTTSGSGGSSIGTSAIAYGAGVYVVAYQTSNSLYYSSDLISFTATASAVASCNKVIYANSQFVAVGNNVIYTSSGGVTWTSQTSPANINYQDVIYANSLYIAYGTFVGANLATSTDGVTWTSRSVGVGNVLQVIYAGGQFVAAGTMGVYTSPDGVTWTSRTTGLTTANHTSIAYIGSTYYAGTNSSGYYATSTDAITWTLKRDASTGGFYGFFNVNSKVVGVGDMGIVILDGGTREAYQPNFTYGTTLTVGTGARQVAYNGSNQYVAINSASLPYYSADGNNWLGAPLSNGGQLSTGNAVFHLNGNYIILATNGSTSIATSSNGTSWTTRATTGATGLISAAFGASTYVAVGGSGSVVSSADAVTWTLRTAGASTFNDVVFGNSLFVAVGASGACYTSPDGTTWTTRSAGANTFSRVIWVAGSINLFIAVGAAGAVYTSPTGVTWTSQSAGAAQFNDIVYNSTSGLLVAVGVSGTIYTSSNGTTWTSRTLGETTYNLGYVIWDGTQYTIHPSNTATAAYFRSTDATTWTRSSYPDQAQTGSVQWIGGKYIRTTTVGSYLSSSTDGVTWRAADQVSYRATTGFSFDTIQKVGSTYFVVGFNNTYPIVYTSTDGITFSPSRTAVRGFIAYTGTHYFSAWKGTGGSLGIYRSSDGATWTHYSDLGTSATSTRTFAVQTIPPEIIWANSKLSLYVGTTAASTSLNTQSLYYSSDGLTWSEGNSPIGGVIGTNAAPGVAATNGTTIVAPFSISSTAGATYKSTDGGVTWSALVSQVNAINIYSGGYWNFGSVKTPDASTLLGLNSAITFLAFSSYNGYTFSITGSGANVWETSTNSLSNFQRFFTGIPNAFALVAGYKEAPVRTSDSRVLAQGQYVSLNTVIVNPIVEYPLFSYDTTTTFYVPQQVVGLASNEYIYAGP